MFFTFGHKQLKLTVVPKKDIPNSPKIKVKDNFKSSGVSIVNFSKQEVFNLQAELNVSVMGMMFGQQLEENACTTSSL